MRNVRNFTQDHNAQTRVRACNQCHRGANHLPERFDDPHADSTGRHVLHLSRSRLEACLDARRFVRVHRTHIVNLEQVRAFRPDARGNLEAELLDGARVPVSRARAQEIRSLGR